MTVDTPSTVRDPVDAGGTPRPFWDRDRETRPPAERDAIILERMRHQLRYVYENLPFYRRLYDAHGLRPDDVRSLADFTAKVPVVKKKMLVDDQREHPPFGSYLGVRQDKLARIHGSSGTTGTPTMYGVSSADWQRSADVSAMGLWCAGVRPGDIVQITFPFSLFFGGWGVLQATECLGATTFPTGSVVPTDQQIEFIFKLGCTVLIGTPSYLMHLGRRAAELGKDLSAAPVRLLIGGGEPGASIPATRATLKKLWGDPIFVDASAGSTSEMYPFLANIGCPAAEGGVHLFQDENYTEIVDRDEPNTAVPDGSSGVPVVTHLWRESQPMIRFWTGDETVRDSAPCACGRTYPRLPRGVFGRVDDMLIVRGANIYPSAVEAVIRKTDGLGGEFRIIVERTAALDEMRVEAEADPAVPAADYPQLAARLADQLKLALQVRVPAQIVAPGTHDVQTFKARRVIDRRRTG
jgi:phenylacetate-CoA ligase